MQGALLAAFVLSISFALWVFPLQSKFVNPIKRTVRNAFIMIFKHILRTVFMLIVSVLPFLLSVKLFPLMLLLGFSVPIYVCAITYNKLFEKMEQPLILKLYLDQRPVSQELESFTEALVSLTDKLSIAVERRQSSQDIAPCVKLCRTDGTETGLGFHGVPGGHEFTSFILGLYNAAGPGQTLDIDTKREIEEIREPVNFKILVTLSCTMCPDLVIAAQRMASINPMITAEVYDIHHFEELKNKHQVMSVPCLVINDTTVSFGKKNHRQLIDLIKTSKLE